MKYKWSERRLAVAECRVTSYVVKALDFLKVILNCLKTKQGSQSV